ncbi:unnamed protein product [Protopolystoma xenopodis]|uniref:Uncharacterized protein n=1 Tax=Protopolystoma xenopodis TaxID=117903 RepID=A0A448WQX6_9PLAT|nr:unnamed protein product [Protopolystoma xenopodis]
MTDFSSRASLALKFSWCDADLEHDLEAVVSQLLREQIELLEAVLLSLHVREAETDNSRSFPPGTIFDMLFETFRKHFFSIKPELECVWIGHNSSIQQICLLQTFILIRAAYLDSSELFSDKSIKGIESTTSNHHLAVKSRLTLFLNSILILSEASLRFYGPLLLLGAVCASAFAQIPDDTNPCKNFECEDDSFSWQRILSIGSQLAYVSIDRLNVFDFLYNCPLRFSYRFSEPDAQLLHSVALSTGTDSEDQPTFLSLLSHLPYQNTTLDSELSDSLSLVDLAAHVCLFDLLSLLAKNIALDSMDPSLSSNSKPSFDGEIIPVDLEISKRSLFLRLFSRTLAIVVTHSSCSIITRQRDIECNISSRIANLIEELAEG